MQKDMIAINDSAFDELIVKFYKVKEELNEAFGAINSLVDSLENNYQCDAGKKLISSYHTFADTNYALVLDNMETYIEDLKAVRTNYGTFDTKLSMQINEERVVNRD